MCSLQWKARVPSPCSDRPSLHAQTMATLPCRCLPRLTSPAAYTSLQLPPQTLPIVTVLSIASLPHSMAVLLNKSRALAFLLSGLGFWFPSIFLLAESRPDLADSEAMSDLRRSLQAPPSLGWRGPDSCNWENVVCSEGRVTAIQIGDRNLEGGPLPASLNKLAMLERLELQGNGVSGPLPSLQGLSSLSVLILSGNRFSSIPGDFFDGLAALQSVAVDGNPFSAWEIPASLGNASALQNFSASSANVVGTISPSFAELKSLRSLNLADNRLTGSIPEELAALPELAQLDVSRNRLHGRVPAFRSESIVRIDGNPDMAMEERVSGPPSGEAANTSSNESPAPIGLIVLSATGGLFLFSSLCVLLGFCLYRGKQKQKQFIRVQSQKADPDGSSKIPAAVESPVGKIGAMAIPIRVLRSVTDDFSEANVLGRGGFGTVYRGELQDGTKVAVKRMDPGAAPGKGSSEFQSEIAVLTRVRHRNLVSLLGYCLEGGERLLVYEYMPQGTLSRHVFGWAAESGLGRPMEWARRLAVALDVARGVEYLHALAHQSFIHRDLKPSNILLGDDLRAKVADFGLVRLAPDGKCSIQTTIAGTFGYLAPEYAATGRVSTKVDVYSFGVILMELVTGRKSLDDRRSEDSLHLVPWFRRLLSHQDSFRPAVDPAIDLADEDTFASVSAVAELSGHCCRRDPSQRPEMSHVVGVLSSLVEQWKPGTDRNPDGVDSELSLPRVLEMWRASEEESGDLGCSSSSSYLVPGLDGARPARPSDFAALDGR